MGADSNAATGAYGTALSFAVAAGKMAMVRLLIERGAEVGEDSYAFAAAASNEDLQMLKLLLTHGETSGVTNAHPKAYGSALQSACGHGNLDATRLLLDRGADPSISGYDYSSPLEDRYSTPLEAAAFNGRLPVVRLLIERGAYINKRVSGHTFLMRAVNGKDEHMVTYLLQNGARDASCLPVGVRLRCNAVTKQLLEHGMDVNARDATAGTPRCIGLLNMVIRISCRSYYSTKLTRAFGPMLIIPNRRLLRSILLWSTAMSTPHLQS